MFSSNNSQVANDAVFVEDVFSNFLYTGNGSTQTITNGIDLAGKGGLVWLKSRNNASSTFYSDPSYSNHFLTSAAGVGSQSSNTTQDASGYTNIPTYNANGFNDHTYWSSTDNVASWTFRKQPKFYTQLTWTGNGVSGRTISHDLGSVPGCIIIKSTTRTSDWVVYHRSVGTTKTLILNSTAVSADYGNNISSVTATSFNITDGSDSNANGDSYVCHVFAHNAGGFGLTGTDNVISCGSFTTDGDGNATVNLGYEPQFLIQRMSENADDWYMLDIMRGSPYTYAIGVDNQKMLKANTSGAEANTNGRFNPNATGFNVYGLSGSSVYIYIAIRRGPMKVPTDATTVFSPNQTSGTTGTQITTGFPVDWQLLGINAGNVYNQRSSTRLTGVNTDGTSNSQYLVTSNTNAEAATASVTLNWGSTGYQVPSLNSGSPIIGWNFGRAPSYMDVVCYTGVGYPTALTVNHNLGVAPEMMIVKKRSATQSWFVYHAAMGNDQEMYLNQAASMQPTTYDWNSTTPSATTFTVNASTNNSGATYVAYLFATCAGVSKVGSYTGTGATQTIDCGFASGARFVLIKRYDSTGTWYVWDTARGMVSGTDPYLLLDSTAAETNTNSVYTTSVGFQIVSTAAGINASGGTYIYFSVA